jgi:hypothetical protein
MESGQRWGAPSPHTTGDSIDCSGTLTTFAVSQTGEPGLLPFIMQRIRVTAFLPALNAAAELNLKSSLAHREGRLIDRVTSGSSSGRM